MRSVDITMRLLALTVSLFVVSTAQDGTELNFIPGGPYKRGGYVNIMCRAKAVNKPLDMIKIVKIGSNGNTQEISTNTDLNDPFKAAGYALMPSTSPDNLYREITINIRNMSGADRGVLECQHIPLNGEMSTARETFDVLVPLKSVEILQYNEDSDLSPPSGGRIILREGEDHGVACRIRVEDSQVEPTITILLDGEENVLDQFSVEDNPTVSGPEGLQKHDNTLTYEMLTSNPPASFNNRTLTCSGTMPGYEKQPRSDSVLIEVHYAPRLNCSDHHGMLGQQLEIQCQSHMNPGMKSVSVIWDRDGDKSYELNLDNKDNGRHHLEVQISSNGQYKFVIRVDNLEEEDFGLYRLDVENSHSPVSSNFELIQVIPSTESTSILKLTTTPIPVTETITDSSSTGPPSDGAAVTSSGRVVASLLVLVSAVLLSSRWS